MKAVRMESFGGPEVLAYGELPDPVPGPGEALVRVKACALNHLDLWVRKGLPAYKIKFPHVLGSDIAGEVAGFGPDAKPAGVDIGSRVVLAPGISCGRCPSCKAGRENLCDGHAVLGADGGWGGYAEFVKVPARNVLPMPAEEMAFTQAASIPLAFLTAFHMLRTLANVAAGQTVLVTGAGGGVGVAAVQIANSMGARVIAASTSRDKLAAAKALGAQETVLVPSESLTDAVRGLTGGRGADVIVEHVGPPLFSDALRALAPGGALVTCGSTGGASAQGDMRQLFFREKRILGAKLGSIEELRAVLALFAVGKLKPVVDKVFALHEARQAHEYLEARRQFGKIVLTI